MVLIAMDTEDNAIAIVVLARNVYTNWCATTQNMVVGSSL